MTQALVAIPAQSALTVASVAADTGFLPRFLICEPPSAIGTRMHANAQRNDLAYASFAVRLRDIFESPLPMGPETRELQPRTLQLCPDACALLVAFSDATEVAQAPGEDLALSRGRRPRRRNRRHELQGY